MSRQFIVPRAFDHPCGEAHQRDDLLSAHFVDKLLVLDDLYDLLPKELVVDLLQSDPPHQFNKGPLVKVGLRRERRSLILSGHG